MPVLADTDGAQTVASRKADARASIYRWANGIRYNFMMLPTPSYGDGSYALLMK